MSTLTVVPPFASAAASPDSKDDISDDRGTIGSEEPALDAAAGTMTCHAELTHIRGSTERIGTLTIPLPSLPKNLGQLGVSVSVSVSRPAFFAWANKDFDEHADAHFLIQAYLLKGAYSLPLTAQGKSSATVYAHKSTVNDEGDDLATFGGAYQPDPDDEPVGGFTIKIVLTVEATGNTNDGHGPCKHCAAGAVVYMAVTQIACEVVE